MKYISTTDPWIIAIVSAVIVIFAIVFVIIKYRRILRFVKHGTDFKVYKLNKKRRTAKNIFESQSNNFSSLCFKGISSAEDARLFILSHIQCLCVGREYLILFQDVSKLYRVARVQVSSTGADASVEVFELGHMFYRLDQIMFLIPNGKRGKVEKKNSKLKFVAEFKDYKVYELINGFSHSDLIKHFKNNLKSILIEEVEFNKARGFAGNVESFLPKGTTTLFIHAEDFKGHNTTFVRKISDSVYNISNFDYDYPNHKKQVLIPKTVEIEL